MTRSIPTILLSLLGSILFWSCCPEDPFVATKIPVIPEDSAKQAYLRVIIIDPDITPVNVAVDGEAMFTAPVGHLDYPEEVYEAQFWPVDTAARELTFAAPGETPLATTAISCPTGSYQTAYLFKDDIGQHQILLTNDNPKSVPGISEVRYRIVNLARQSPTVDILFKDQSSGKEFKVEDLGFGDTTAILTQTSSLQKELKVVNSNTGEEIIALPNVLLPGSSVVTLVMAGELRPRGNDKFFFFNIFTDSRLDDKTDLYGSLPLPLELVAVRFINLVGYADSTLDLALEDKLYGCDFPECFRRNLPKQNEAVIAVAPLGTDPQYAEKGYFFLSKLLDIANMFRVEVHSLEFYDTSDKQTVLVSKQAFDSKPSGRYTFVAFGPFDQSQAQATIVEDLTPAPAAGMVNVRFFHGAYASFPSEKLQIRISGQTGPLMEYGQAPSPQSMFMTTGPTASANVQVLDESGAVVHTQNAVEFKADKTYTVFLSEGPDGNGLFLKPLAEDVVPE